LDTIEGMIPRHPNCRCVALPQDVTEVEGAVAKEAVEEVTGLQWVDISKRKELPQRLKEMGVENLDDFAIPRSLEDANAIGRNMTGLQNEADRFGIKRITHFHTERHHAGIWSAPYFGINNTVIRDLRQSTRPAKGFGYSTEDVVAPENRVKALFDHEFGHLIASRKQNERGRFLETYLESLNINRLKVPTMYAKSNDAEWFAESWAAYKNGREDLLDDKFFEILDDWRLR